MDAEVGGAGLDEVQGRVLGCLVEKQRTTPEDYPLTANALTRACNQSTSRDPVVSFEQARVERALEALKAAGLVRFVFSPSNRATRHRHVLDEAWSLSDAELVVLALLLLRGPQTAGELRSRSGRMHPFGGPDEVVAVLHRLAEGPGFVVELPREPGRKEARWDQTVADRPGGGRATPEPASAPVAPEVAGATGPADRPTHGASGDAASGGARLDDLERRLAATEAEVRRLRAALEQAVGPLD